MKKDVDVVDIEHWDDKVFLMQGILPVLIYIVFGDFNYTIIFSVIISIIYVILFLDKDNIVWSNDVKRHKLSTFIDINILWIVLYVMYFLSLRG